MSQDNSHLRGANVLPIQETGTIVKSFPVANSHRPHFAARLFMRFCHCIIDNDYQETLSFNDEIDESFYLDPQPSIHSGKNTLVLDLDETLVHSSLQPDVRVDFVLQFQDNGCTNSIYVLKRPGLEQFLEAVGELFEVVLFTASLPAYANPLVDKIDRNKVISFRLFRSSCRVQPFGFLKDLARLGRDLNRVIIIDVHFTQNSPQSYALHPGNAIPITSWFNDEKDTELLSLLPTLRVLANSTDVVSDIEKLVHRKKENVEEATMRGRSPLNSPVHNKTSREGFEEAQKTVDISTQLEKRCATDSLVRYS